MNIKGEYRDVLSRNGKVIADTGWKSNTIVDDYGRFLAALMKKDFGDKVVGIDYMAVGSGSANSAAFKENVIEFFKSGKLDQPYKPTPEDWVWANKIEAGTMIRYLDEKGNVIVDPNKITNKLEIKVKFGETEPSGDTLEFREFALLGIDKSNPDMMFFINYVDHGLITKDPSMELTRTIELTFPIGEHKEVES
jgi:hypothetical protein